MLESIRINILKNPKCNQIHIIMRIINCLLIFLLLSLSGFAVPNDDNDGVFVPQIGRHDSVYVYDGWLTNNRLEDRPHVAFREEDRAIVNQLLDRKIKSDPLFLKDGGIFIEIRTENKDVVCALYLTRRNFTMVSKREYGSRSYIVPKKMRPAVDSLIAFYKNAVNDQSIIHRFDTCEMTSKVRVIRSFFAPGKKLICIDFYVYAEPSEILPITYYVYKGRKKLSVARTIPLWRRYKIPQPADDDKQDAQHKEEVQHATDPVASKILSEVFPGWDDMSDGERMRALDDNFGKRKLVGK